MKSPYYPNKNVPTEHEHVLGFTLVETLIYVGIFALMVGGVAIVTYQIIQAAEDAEYKIVVQEEAGFFFHKVDWALSGAQISPFTSNPSNVLRVTKDGVSLVFDLNSGNIRLTRGGAAPVILNSAEVTATNLTFTDMPPASGEPEGVRIDLTLHMQTYAESFEETTYLFK